MLTREAKYGSSKKSNEKIITVLMCASVEELRATRPKKIFNRAMNKLKFSPVTKKDKAVSEVVEIPLK